MSPSPLKLRHCELTHAGIQDRRHPRLVPCAVGRQLPLLAARRRRLELAERAAGVQDLREVAHLAVPLDGARLWPVWRGWAVDGCGEGKKDESFNPKKVRG